MVAGKPKKKSFILTALRFLLLVTLLVAAGLDWYIVYLIDRPDPDFGRVRKFAGIVGGFTLGLVVLILAVVILLIFTGGAALIFKGGLFSISGIYAILVFVLVSGVAGINFAIMPTAKDLTKTPPVVPTANTTEPEDNQDPRVRKVLLLAISGASFGTIIIALYVLYYTLRGVIVSKKVEPEGLRKLGSSAPAGSAKPSEKLEQSAKQVEQALDAAKARASAEAAKVAVTS